MPVGHSGWTRCPASPGWCERVCNVSQWVEEISRDVRRAGQLEGIQTSSSMRYFVQGVTRGALIELCQMTSSGYSCACFWSNCQDQTSSGWSWPGVRYRTGRLHRWQPHLFTEDSRVTLSTCDRYKWVLFFLSVYTRCLCCNQSKSCCFFPPSSLSNIEVRYSDWKGHSMWFHLSHSDDKLSGKYNL